MAGDEIEELVKYLARLPARPRSARRAVLTLMRRREALLDPLTAALAAARDSIKTCNICGNIDTQDPCAICTTRAATVRLSAWWKMSAICGRLSVPKP